MRHKPRRASKPRLARQRGHHRPLRTDQLDALIDEATVDAKDESEQVTGFYAVLEDSLMMPFKTEVLGVEVNVDGIELAEDDRIVAVCARGRIRQRIPLNELPLPHPPPKGWEWIEAYRRWARLR